MMECQCKTRLFNCPTCGRRLLSAHELQHAVEVFRLSIGKEYRGKQVRELLEATPGILDTWSSGKGSTSEMKLLVAYGKFRKAQRDLDLAAHAAGAVGDKAGGPKTGPGGEPGRPKFLPPPLDSARPMTSYVMLPTSWSGTGGSGDTEAVVRAGARCGIFLSTFWGNWRHFWTQVTKVLFHLRGLRSVASIEFLAPFVTLLISIAVFYPAVWGHLGVLAVRIGFTAFFGAASGIGQWIGSSVASMVYQAALGTQ
jgi:hypothetical protein